MDIFQALVLGIVQGITELLPISSSGHLVILPALFGWKQNILAFDTTLHLGTAFALLIYFRKDIGEILSSVFKDIVDKGTNLKGYSENSMLGLKIVIGSVPAGVIGVLFEKTIATYFHEVLSVVVFLLLGTVLMILAERFGKEVINKVGQISVKKSFIIGLFQSLALLSGVSRSGATISGSMLLGIKRDLAAKFSFLLSIPIVLGAGLFELRNLASDLTLVRPEVMLVGFISSFIFSILAVNFLLGFLKNHKLNVFIWYRLILALILLAFLFR